MVSLIFSRGGPYPSPLFLANRERLFDRVAVDEDEGATKAETSEVLMPATAAAPSNASFDVENFI